MISDPVALTAALVALVALAEWLDRSTWLRHLGAALLVIVLTSLVANLGIIPTYGPDTPVYEAVFEYVAPLGIFWLLLLVDLRSLRRAGGPTLFLFLVGAAGTVAGVLVAHGTVGAGRVLGPMHGALAGMFTGTYIGGSVNFNAIALEYRVVENGSLYAGAAAVDSGLTTFWMAATVALPRLLAPFWPRRRGDRDVPGSARLPVDDQVETSSVFDLAVIIGLGVGAVALAGRLADGLQELTALAVPDVLILTTLALALAQIPAVQRLRGTRMLGLFTVYLFLAVIGALCDVAAVARIGALAPILVGFVCVLIAVHGLMVFGAAYALRLDPEVAAVASQANIGGGTSALALARSLGRGDLELPAILVGSLGTALGNYLGFMMVVWLSG